MSSNQSQQRPKVIIGNWKMYKTIGEAKEFVETLTPRILASQAKVCLAPPFTAIYSLVQLCQKLKSKIHIGAQNMYHECEGAFTGEISGKMLLEAGAEFVLLGHSERRLYCQETSPEVNKKIKMALKAGIRPVLCVGENEAQRASGETKKVLEKELMGSLADVTAGDLAKMWLAYEPVWAIGTGKTASPEDAEEAQSFCREVLRKKWGEVADSLVIMYGGSVKESNAKDLVSMKNVDGLLVGGASLDPNSFSQIINNVKL